MLEIATLTYWLYVGGALTITITALFYERASNQIRKLKLSRIYEQFGVVDVEN